MAPVFSVLATSIVLVVALGGLPAKAGPATLLTEEQAAQIVSLRDVTIKNGEVSGEVVNNSKQTLRDVELQILYSWRWKDEFNPGKDDRGMAVYHRVDKEIPPGESVRFTYKPSPPPAVRDDGSFEIGVSVAGFARVFR